MSEGRRRVRSPKTQTRKAPRTKRYSDRQIIAALRVAKGNVVDAAAALHCDFSTIYRRIKAMPEVQEVLEEAREELLDITERALLKQIEEGNTACIIFTLKTAGKYRGYQERQEISILNNPAYVKACEKFGTTPAAEFERLMQRIAEQAEE